MSSRTASLSEEELDFFRAWAHLGIDEFEPFTKR